MERWREAELRGMEVVRTYEEQVRGATLFDLSSGRMREAWEWFERHGYAAPPVISADFLSASPEDERIIEVKARGSVGPITVIDRELDTFRAARGRSWLYCVGYVTQPFPVRLYIVEHPADLPWSCTREAERSPSEARGTRHEAQYTVEFESISDIAELVDVSNLGLPAWAGANKD
jgi:hypothetical protein